MSGLAPARPRRLALPIPVLVLLMVGALPTPVARADTTVLWLFDEQPGIHPGSVLSDAGPEGYFLALGRGAHLEAGRFGRALRIAEPPPLHPQVRGLDEAQRVKLGLEAPPQPAGRRVPPLTWANATFAAALLHGEAHLRGDPLPHPTAGAPNLGAGDFTLEFWLRTDPGARGEGVVFEIGSGPRGENDRVTRLSLRPAESRFELVNEPSGTRLSLPTDPVALRSGAWVHYAFVYDRAHARLRHYANGRLQGAPVAARLEPLPEGSADYLSIGRDGLWQRPLAGALDELRISDRQVYSDDFPPPDSFSRRPGPPRLASGPPLLFPGGRPASLPVALGGRRYLFLDDALIAHSEHVSFTAHPARIEEIVLPFGTGWTSVADGDDGQIRLYGECEGGTCVWTSRDGVHFAAPDLPGGRGNRVADDPARRGSVFRDPNAAPGQRWKLLTGSARRGLFVYSSPDGFAFRRNEVTALPFTAGSAPTAFYDDQRRLYVATLRSDYGATASGKTERFAVRAETVDPLAAWPFAPATPRQERELAQRMRTRHGILDPWWLDNGPLSPPGPGAEYPVAMARDPALDPPATDLYNLRAIKYPWAPDAYLAFPLWFFHFDDGPPARRALASPERGLGTGLVEVQLAVSRDGLRWTRYPRPAYVAPGEHEGYPIRRPYIAFGMVRRGAEIWQYCYSRSSYHSPYGKEPRPPVVHRLVQRVDGFVSADGSYAPGGELVTHPLRFSGRRLVLNIDTGATGHAQVGFLDEHGHPIPGFSVDEGVYVSGDAIDQPVEWLGRGSDVSALAGRTVQLVVRLRGASLYALQFVEP